MKVYFDDDGYPAHITFTREEKEVLNSDNFVTLRQFYDKIGKVVNYWRSVEEKYESSKYGEISEEEYQRFMKEKLKEHFSDDIKSCKSLSLY